MTQKMSLLQMKKRLIAFALAGACAIGLTGCAGEHDTADTTQIDVSDESVTPERKLAVVMFFEEQAVVIHCNEATLNKAGTVYSLNYYFRNEERFTHRIPADNAYVISPTSSYNAEEFIAAAKGPDFPISYLYDYDISEEEQKLTK